MAGVYDQPEASTFIAAAQVQVAQVAANQAAIEARRIAAEPVVVGHVAHDATPAELQAAAAAVCTAPHNGGN